MVLLPSTHVHRLIQALLDLPEPFYLHHPLMLDEAGDRLAKRSESCSIKTLRDHGHSPSDILQMTQQIFDISMDHFHLESNSIKPL